MKKIRTGLWRMVSVLMVMVLMAGMLIGCSKKGEDETQKEDKNTVTENSGNTGAADAEQEKKEPDKLTIWSSFNPTAYFGEQKDTPYWQAYSEACNVELEFIDSTGGKDAMSVLIASGDLPDIIITYDNTLNPQNALVDESIIPLNEVMDAGYMPNFKAYLESDP